MRRVPRRGSVDGWVHRRLCSRRWSALLEELQRRLQDSQRLLLVWEGHCGRAAALTGGLQTLRAVATATLAEGDAPAEGDEEQLAERMGRVEVGRDHWTGGTSSPSCLTLPMSSRTSCRQPSFCSRTCRWRWRPPGR